MIAHLVGSSSDMDADFQYLNAIVKAVRESNASLIRNWVDTANHRMTEGSTPYTPEEWEDIMSENEAALASADVVIVEATHNRFSQGYQLASALHTGKPTLLLYRGDEPRSFIGLSSELLEKAHYETQEDLNKVISKFISEHRAESAKRHIEYKMSPLAQKRLEAMSAKTGKTSDQILNDLVELSA